MNSKDIFGNFNGKHQQEADKKIVTPISFETKDTKGVKPILFSDQEPNDNRHFAILKTTENGKYVKGEMLFFKINGVELYTDINNVMFVDLNANTVFIKEYSKISDEIAPEDPKNRQYIIMMTIIDNEDHYVWESMSGRKNAYDFIVGNIDGYGIDPERSFVLTDNVAFKDALTVTQFVQYLKNAELVEEDDFDITEYIQ